MDGTILNTFFTLIAAVAVMGVFLYLVRRYASKIKHSGAEIELNVLSKISLQPKNHLYVVKAGSRVLLLGVAEKSITPIADLTGKIESTQSTKATSSLKINPDRKEISNEDLSFKTFIKSVLNKQIN